LLLVANESFTNAEKDIEILTGLKIPHSTQHRLVNNYQLLEPMITKKAKSLSLDGGTIRLRTPLGNKSEWKNYKAVKIHERVGTAFFQNKEGLLKWVNQQPLSRNITCLGDGRFGSLEFDRTNRKEGTKKRGFGLVSLNGKFAQSGGKY